MRTPFVFPAIGAIAVVGCGSSPPPVVAPAPTVTAVAPPPTATATAAPEAPKEALPSMHPCVPDFIVKELHACEPGAQTLDYSAVANAMDAMAKAGPFGPPPKAGAGQRDLLPHEEKAASAARSFLCRAPSSELDDEHAAVAFELGRLYMNAQHFEDASVFLRDAVILDPQKHAEPELAARFLIEAVGALAKTRPECAATYDALSAAVVKHVCEGPGADQRKESCEGIAAAKASAGPKKTN